MISFEVKLSVNQIACLRAVKAIQESGEWNTKHISHGWFAGTKYLIAERLIEVITRDPSVEERRKGHLKVHEWRVTDKGLLLLRVIELDILDAAAGIDTEAIIASQLSASASNVERISSKDRDDRYDSAEDDDAQAE